MSAGGTLLSMEAGLKSFDPVQMSEVQELMSGVRALLTFGFRLTSMTLTRESVYDKHKSFKPDQMSGVETLKPFDDTLKPIINTFKSFAQLFQKSKSLNMNLPDIPSIQLQLFFLSKNMKVKARGKKSLEKRDHPELIVFPGR